MSWLFGMGGGQNIPDVAPQFPLPPAAPGGGEGGDDGKGSGSKDDQKTKMDAYRFDSAALERAAKAAKELEKSSEYKYT